MKNGDYVWYGRQLRKIEHVYFYKGKIATLDLRGLLRQSTLFTIPATHVKTTWQIINGWFK